MEGNKPGPDPEPYYQRHVFCCMNIRPADHPRGCCSAKGSVGLRNYMKDRAHAIGLESTRINGAQCLDRCEYGPVMVIYPEGVWYQYRTREDVDEILETHLRQGGRVKRLQLLPEQLSPPKSPKPGA